MAVWVALSIVCALLTYWPSRRQYGVGDQAAAQRAAVIPAIVALILVVFGAVALRRTLWSEGWRYAVLTAAAAVTASVIAFVQIRRASSPGLPGPAAGPDA
jgi:hypothetical protein